MNDAIVEESAREHGRLRVLTSRRIAALITLVVLAFRLRRHLRYARNVFRYRRQLRFALSLLLFLRQLRKS